MSFLVKLRQQRLQKLGRAGKLPAPDSTLAPQQLFRQWFAFNAEAGIPMPEAMSLATSSNNGKPSTRMVLMKEYNEHEFVFYTNYNSRKGQEIEQNPNAALLFHWKILERQIRIEGTISKVSRQRSIKYFHSRDRLSQLGAHASAQSQSIDSREALEKQLIEIESMYPDEIPLPEHWGGYSLKPNYFEFWQGRPGRIHDRICYKNDQDKWVPSRLQP